MNEKKRALKRQYIPLFVSGEITNKECATLCGIFTVSDLNIKISKPTFAKILNDNDIHSPLERKPKKEKKQHLPRKERPCEGELCQLDASKHEWFIGKPMTCIHGGIDDATHKVTALYMCENECLLGYQETLLQTYERNAGFPKATYTDRSAIFVTTKKNLEHATIEEQLQGYEKKPTQWQKMCNELNIEIILALCAEGSREKSNL